MVTSQHGIVRRSQPQQISMMNRTHNQPQQISMMDRTHNVQRVQPQVYISDICKYINGN